MLDDFNNDDRRLIHSMNPTLQNQICVEELIDLLVFLYICIITYFERNFTNGQREILILFISLPLRVSKYVAILHLHLQCVLSHSDFLHMITLKPTPFALLHS